MDKLKRRRLFLRYDTGGGTSLHVIGESPDAVLLSTVPHPTRGEFVPIDLGDLLPLSPDESEVEAAIAALEERPPEPSQADGG